MLKNGNWDKLFGGHHQRVAKSPSTDIGYVDLVFIRTAQLLDSISTTVIFMYYKYVWYMIYFALGAANFCSIPVRISQNIYENVFQYVVIILFIYLGI